MQVLCIRENGFAGSSYIGDYISETIYQTIAKNYGVKEALTNAGQPQVSLLSVHPCLELISVCEPDPGMRMTKLKSCRLLIFGIKNSPCIKDFSSFFSQLCCFCILCEQLDLAMDVGLRCDHFFLSAKS
jgi:hypothetical protein